MPTTPLLSARRILPGLALAAATLSGGAAWGDMILFDDAPQTNITYWAASEASNDYVYSGDYALKMDRVAYSESGLNTHTGGAILIDGTTLQMQLYLTSGTVNQIKLSTVDSSNTDISHEYRFLGSGFTIDGQEASWTSLAFDTWYTIELDLSLLPGLIEGDTELYRIAIKPGGLGMTLYADDIRIVPEPASLLLMSAGVAVVARRRRA